MVVLFGLLDGSYVTRKRRSSDPSEDETILRIHQSLNLIDNAKSYKDTEKHSGGEFEPKPPPYAMNAPAETSVANANWGEMIDDEESDLKRNDD